MDTINGLFEAMGEFFIIPSIIKLNRDKAVKGISWVHAGFFWSWGLWNLFYYPSLDQWASFAGVVGLFAVNTVWLSQLLFYSHANRRK